MATCGSKNFEGFRLSTTFGTPYETDKDRAKRELMEHMPGLRIGDEILVVDPDAEFPDQTQESLLICGEIK